jgi:hypothetical protein
MAVEKCAFCQATATTEQAVELEWIPYFFDRLTDKESKDSCCPTCAETKLEYDPIDDEFFTKP